MKPDWASQATGTGRGSTDSVPRLHCPSCGNDVVPVVYKRGPHLRADCSGCGEYMRFIGKGTPWAYLAEPEVTPPPQTPLFGGWL